MKPATAASLAIGAVVLAAVAGAQSGPQNPPTGRWYDRLDKPSYTPRGSFIGAVWGALDVLLCVTGYRLLRAGRSTARSLALVGWAADLLCLAGFQPVFFGARQLGAGTAVSASMLGSAATTAVAARYSDRIAGAAALPLVMWTAFATLLSEEIWRRNPQ